MKTESTNARKLHKKREFSYILGDTFARKFVDPKTGIFYTKHTRIRSCPVCGSKQYRDVFFKDGGTYVKCTKCTMIYTNPVFKEASLKEFYTKVDSGQAKITVQEAPFYTEIYSLGLKATTKFVKPGTILDVGCGSGFFLDIAKKKKWKTSGLELSPSDVAIARRGGHQIYDDLIEKVSFNEKFSAVTLWDVFEHIVDGATYLRRLAKLLAPGGVVFMQIPNSGSLAARILRDKCNMFHSLGHVNLYNPKTIQLIAEKNGFEIVYLKTVISEAAVIENYLNYEHPYFGFSKYNGKVLGFISPETIHKHNLGYKMQIVMRPKKKK